MLCPRMRTLPLTTLLLSLLALLCDNATAEVIVPRNWLVIGPVNVRGRRPFNPDAIFERYLLYRNAPPPAEGDRVEGDDGRADAWKSIEADESGRVNARAVYAYARVRSPRACVALARVPGGATLFVNGDAFVGDIYSSRHSGVPVPLTEGENHVFVRGVRGSFRLELELVPEGLILPPADATLPDLVIGERFRGAGAVVVLNASPRPMEAVLLTAQGQHENGWTGAPAGIVPFGLRKLPVSFSAPPRAAAGAEELSVRAMPTATQSFTLHIREPDQPRRITFRSAIDGSVQQYSVLPPPGNGVDAAVVLSLHGASVDAYNQAHAYSARPGYWIVAPTNRRPFGFDWQDWGRWDAYEVLRHAIANCGADERRVYLTGHSMGGHGAWHLAANDPDRFLAVAPSAGWATFETYVGRPGSLLQELWAGADGASDTLSLISNLAQVPTFILHGVEDDNVPLREALLMESLLIAEGAPPAVHYQPGAGHWWDGQAAPGADCVDWPGIFDHFERCPPRPDPEEIEFVSVDAGVDDSHHWLRLVQPLSYGQPSRIHARREGDSIVVKTHNVRAFEAWPLLQPVEYRIDGDEVPSSFQTRLLRSAEGWRAGVPAAGEKRPERCGPFKRAFANGFVFVYGANDREALARARYDAQSWWYRGNGDVPVVTDAAFLAGGFEGRNVICYGNADGNRAWDAVFPDRCPVRAERGRLVVGGRRFEGDSLAAVFVYPRRDSPGALAAAFAHTGPRGARLGYGLLTFSAGVGYPDYAVFSERVLIEGDGGVLAAGWFGPDWSLDG